MKRLICLILVCTLLLCAVPAANSATATGIVFLAVNDSIPIALSADTMPFYSAGTLYVPYTLFDVTALGVTSSYNVLSETLTLFTSKQRIVFDLANGTSSDSTGTGASWGTISKGSTIFVPADYCASCFGISVSYLSSLGGYAVVRFTTGAQVYDDSYFIEKADSLIESRVTQYFSTSETTVATGTSSTTNSSTATTQTPATTTQPVTTPAVTPEEPEEAPEEEPEEETEEEAEEEEPEEEEEEPENAPIVETYLVFYHAEGMQAMAEELEAMGLHGAFFLTAEELADHPTLLSRLRAGGHSVGILLDEEDPAAIAQANALADLQTKQPLLWVYARSGSEAATALGYLVLTPKQGTETWQLVEIDCVAQANALTQYTGEGYLLCTLLETTILP